MRLPKEIETLIFEFAAYYPAPWVHVKEHYRGDYGWVPQILMVQDLVELPMW